MSNITCSEAWAELNYDAESGIFTRRGRNAGKIAGTVTNHGYVVVRVLGERVKAHRLAWLMANGRWPDSGIDHINGIKTDNRIDNLREATAGQNNKNRRVKSYSYYQRRKKWYVRIQGPGKKNLVSGYFQTEGEARVFAQAAKACLYGEWAPDPIAALQDEISEWADTVYPSRTATQAMIKLVMEEIPEILQNPTDPLEFADAIILLIDAAKLSGIDIVEAAREKMAINRRRSWKVDPDTGVMRHV